MAEASDLGSEGCAFESHPGYARIAQTEEAAVSNAAQCRFESYCEYYGSTDRQDRSEKSTTGALTKCDGGFEGHGDALP